MTRTSSSGKSTEMVSSSAIVAPSAKAACPGNSRTTAVSSGSGAVIVGISTVASSDAPSTGASGISTSSTTGGSSTSGSAVWASSAGFGSSTIAAASFVTLTSAGASSMITTSDRSISSIFTSPACAHKTRGATVSMEAAMCFFIRRVGLRITKLRFKVKIF